MLDATPAQLEFLDSELARFEACRAWERTHNSRYVSHMFLVPKPGHNQWRLIIDLRELNRYYSELTMNGETLKHLRHLPRPGDLLELGTDSYTAVVPAPQGGAVVVTREVGRERWRPAKAPAGPAARHK
jgi:hypothetical protein